MHVYDTPEAVRDWAQRQRCGGRRIAVVPTMGALHAGHLELIAEAHRRADSVVVTIFVNPLQFNQSLDFDLYPRPIDGDLAACEAARVDAVYAPTAATMYPPGFETHVAPGALAERLEGAMRPGHFAGVATVVTKLLAATQPDMAIFGEKDYQQLAVVRRMTRDLDLGVEIVGVATVREPDGLALSSRNARLSADDRAAAVVISRALAAISARVAEGEHSASALVELATDLLGAERRAKVEYVAIVDADSLEPVEVVTGPTQVVAAVWFGGVRLIDNCRITPTR